MSLFDAPDDLARDVAHSRAGAARDTDPTTSKRAARNVEPRTGSQRAYVLATFAAAGAEGLTLDQLAEQLGDVRASSWRTRANELATDYDPPLVEDTGRERTTRSGEAARVLAITSKGRMVNARVVAR